MSKPLYELVDERVWMVLAALIVLAVVTLSIIGMMNTEKSDPYSIEEEYYYDEKYGGFEPYDGR